MGAGAEPRAEGGVRGSLAGRVALVTGGSRSIGREIALDLARAGADLVVVGRDQPALEETAAEIAALGRKVHPARCDIAVESQVEALAKSVEGVFPGVDILVNNAGVTEDGLLFRMKAADWERVLDTNLKGSFFCTRAFARGMTRRRWGRIICVSSVVGVMGNAGQANYAASKAGLIGFTKSVAKELASRGVTANCVAPGYVETAMTQVLSEGVKEQMLAAIPLGRFGQPSDVAPVVTFLASDQAAYITGQVVHVDGGMVM
ncbi:MAG TPA: 3-oxoacyl-[acyl-carrier-protein] reductase [Candidatus Udaeobacter sp.]|nr:3-oxoacyl-[acyl-carrier-protein] reductase [Candidatus Udaeobacter sp.]